MKFTSLHVYWTQCNYTFNHPSHHYQAVASTFDEISSTYLIKIAMKGKIPTYIFDKTPLNISIRRDIVES